MRYFKTLSVALLLVVAIPSASANAVVEWELKDESVSLGMNGASPHVVETPSGDRVFRNDGGSTTVSLCSDAGVCSTEALSVTSGPLFDISIVKTRSGSRAYFKRIVDANTQAVYSAACIDLSCLSLGAATATSPLMSVSSKQGAWGVPDAVALPNGDVRIYLVETGPQSSKCPEIVSSYISVDGITFNKEPGTRLTGGFVDTEILRAKNGDWLMIMANGPGCGSAQQLFVSTSVDGLDWSKPQVLTGTDISRLDPTGYEISPDVFRIYYAAGKGGGFDPNAVYTIKRATMRIKDTASSGGVGVTKAKPGKSKTITCVKGKTVRKVVGTTCPKGFKKR